MDARSVARALGGEVTAGQIVAPGPGHGRGDRSLSVRIDSAAPDGFRVHSFAGDDWRDCRDYVRDRLGIAREIGPRRPTEARQQARAPLPLEDDGNAKRLAYAASIVAEMRPVRGTPGEAYLRDARKIDTDAIADVLERGDAIGWHPEVYFKEPGHRLHGQRLGCIVGVMTDAVTGNLTGAVSRTYIVDGRKITKAKTLGQPQGIVRLSHDDDVTAGLFLAEGIETTLDAMARGLRPAWSTGSTALMSAFPPLAGVEALTVIADHDPSGAGEKAARAVEAAWLAAGRETRIFMADAIGDLNDRTRGL